MRQRVALARTVLMDRGVILLDEPFGSLDAVTRAEMRLWLLDVMAAHPATWVLVTHDVDEAVLLGDQVAVLRGRPARLEGRSPATLSRARRRRIAAVARGAGDVGQSWPAPRATRALTWRPPPRPLPVCGAPCSTSGGPRERTRGERPLSIDPRLRRL